VKDQRFDIVYCHRVIQHAPDPRRAFASMARCLRPGGTFFLHSYDRHWKALLHYRYWLRPLTRRLPHTAVFRALTIVGPVLYPLTSALERVAGLRRVVKLLIPFSNHDRVLRKNGSTLSRRERYEYSLLITFDALTPTFDNPSSAATLTSWFAEHGLVDVRVLHRSPAVVMGRKPLERCNAAVRPAAPAASQSAV
jgi:SAM-dependent methyltransferase